MAFTTHLLVVANRTVDSPELIDALRERGRNGPISVTLLAPTAWSERDEAEQRLASAVATLAADDIRAQGIVGDADPMVAVQEAWNPGFYDEVLVSTLTEGASRWLQVDLPHRVARLTDCQVRHVAVPVRHVEERAPKPPPARRSMLESALSLMRSATQRSRAA
jgi:GABA permease